MSDELKPCPLCASPAVMREQRFDNGSIFSVECSDDDGCGLNMPGYGSEGRTALAWNKRPTPPDKPEPSQLQPWSDQSSLPQHRSGRVTYP